MKKLFVVACIAGMSAPAFCASDVEKLDGRINDSRTVIQEIMATPHSRRVIQAIGKSQSTVQRALHALAERNISFETKNTMDRYVCTLKIRSSHSGFVIPLRLDCDTHLRIAERPEPALV